MNQLLAPDKARRAIERAHKDIIDGRFESAQKEITRALDIAPHYANAKAMQGGIYLEIKNYEGAAKCFQSALDDDPASGGAYVGMALVLVHNQRYEAALPMLERGEALLPGAWLVHLVKAWIQLGLGNTDAALKQADFAEQIAGTNLKEKSDVSYLRAMVSIYRNDIDTAKKYLSETIARNPDSSYAPSVKGELARLQSLSADSR